MRGDNERVGREAIGALERGDLLALMDRVNADVDVPRHE
jgi:hypothetical protein